MSLFGGLFNVAFFQITVYQEIALSVFMYQWGSFRLGLVDADNRRLGYPDYGQFVIIKGFQSGTRSHQCQNTFTTVAHQAIGQHRLVFEVGIDAKIVSARHICSAEHFMQAGVASVEIGHIAKLKTGTIMW